MAATSRESDLAVLKRPGDKGCIKKTKSGMFQPQIYDKELDKAAGAG